MNERASILAVEPDLCAGEILRDTLTDLYDLTLVRTGRSAMELLSGGFRVDLVLLDTQLPDTIGEDVLASMREDFPRIPVAMIMSVQEVRAFIRVMELGAIDYVVKPFHPTELRFLISRFLANVETRQTTGLIESGIQFAC